MLILAEKRYVGKTHETMNIRAQEDTQKVKVTKMGKKIKQSTLKKKSVLTVIEAGTI